MTCADFDVLLDEQFGPALLRDDPALFEHAGACGACRTKWDQHRLLADAIGAWRAQAPDVDLTAAVMAGLEPITARPAAEHVALAKAALPATNPAHSTTTQSTTALSTSSQRPPRRTTFRASTIGALDRSRRSLVVAVTALTAMIAVISLVPALRGISPPAQSIALGPRANSGAVIQPSTDVVLRNQNPSTSETDDVRSDELAPYTGLMHLATGAWDEITLLVRPESKDAPAPDRLPQAESKDGWIDGLQHQLKPMGRGLDNAFDFLWQAGQSGDG